MGLSYYTNRCVEAVLQKDQYSVVQNLKQANQCSNEKGVDSYVKSFGFGTIAFLNCLKDAPLYVVQGAFRLPYAVVKLNFGEFKTGLKEIFISPFKALAMGITTIGLIVIGIVKPEKVYLDYASKLDGTVEKVEQMRKEIFEEILNTAKNENQEKTTEELAIIQKFVKQIKKEVVEEITLTAMNEQDKERTSKELKDLKKLKVTDTQSDVIITILTPVKKKIKKEEEIIIEDNKIDTETNTIVETNEVIGDDVPPPPPPLFFTLNNSPVAKKGLAKVESPEVQKKFEAFKKKCEEDKKNGVTKKTIIIKKENLESENLAILCIEKLKIRKPIDLDAIEKKKKDYTTTSEIWGKVIKKFTPPNQTPEKKEGSSKNSDFSVSPKNKKNIENYFSPTKKSKPIKPPIPVKRIKE